MVCLVSFFFFVRVIIEEMHRFRYLTRRSGWIFVHHPKFLQSSDRPVGQEVVNLFQSVSSSVILFERLLHLWSSFLKSPLSSYLRDVRV